MEDLLSDAAHRPDTQFDRPERLGDVLTHRLLPLVAKPARYIGGEVGAARPPWRTDRANILLCFPEVYEIGMSHTGLRVLYSLVNRRKNSYGDLVFCPWPDMERQMRDWRLPLFGLQSRRPARQFDVVAFSVGYELTYTNLLTALDLAGLPLLASQRCDGDPVVIAGGACVQNPQVLAPFLDVQFLGDGEETIQEIVDSIWAAKQAGLMRAELCERLAAIEGGWRPGGGPARTRILTDLNRFPPADDLVPQIESVHDRLTVEVMRGCARGCRFCQAGMIQRPVRERDVRPLVEAAARGCAHGGWPEISLLSLSTSDYSGLSDSVDRIARRLDGTHTNLVLPSLRVDSLDPDLYEQISREAPSSFTFAPEAGSQRLRDVINKQVTETDVLVSARRAFEGGAKHIKLYFMVGLPTEQERDLDAIVDLVRAIVGIAPRGPGQVTVAISPFAPKPHTPFQWAGQLPVAEIARRNRHLQTQLNRLGVKISLREPQVSRLEALLGLGDGRIAEVVLRAWLAGARFDGWTEHFEAAIWERACSEAGIDPDAYLAPKDTGAELPWADVQSAVDRDFLLADWQRAQQGETLADCRLSGQCHDCSACRLEAEHRFAELPPKPVDHKKAEPEPRRADPGPESEPSRWIGWRRQAAQKCWYRVEYSKRGDLRFLGHLDFQRLLQLAMRRAGLPLAYSQGHHPHPQIKYGPPLPVGVSGLREVLDVALLAVVANWRRDLNRALPPGLRIGRTAPLGAVTGGSIDQWVRRMDYHVELLAESGGGPSFASVEAACERFLASKNWPFLRRRPKGDIEIDVRELVAPSGLQVLQDGPSEADGSTPTALEVSLVRAVGKGGLPPHDFLKAVLGPILPEPRMCRIRRLGVFGQAADGRWLTPLEGVAETDQRLWLRKRINA